MSIYCDGDSRCRRLSFDVQFGKQTRFSIHRNAKKMLVDYKADCNLIIPGREIAAIHYAAGMDNVSFAENVMKLMLKNGGMCARANRSEPNVILL